MQSGVDRAEPLCRAEGSARGWRAAPCGQTTWLQRRRGPRVRPSEAFRDRARGHAQPECTYTLECMRAIISLTPSPAPQCIIDVNHYPVETARRSNMRHRPIGIGVQGLADAFILLGMPFESEEAKQLNREIFEVGACGPAAAVCLAVLISRALIANHTTNALADHLFRPPAAQTSQDHLLRCAAHLLRSCPRGGRLRDIRRLAHFKGHHAI